MINTRRLIPTLFFLSILLFAVPAHAIFFWGVKGLGMGTAAVGIADDNNAMEINPAGAAQGRTYSIDAVYERREYEIFDYLHIHPDLEEEDENLDFYGGELFGNDDEINVSRDEKEVIDSWRVSIIDSATVRHFAMGMYFTGQNLTSNSYDDGLGFNTGLCMAYSFADIVYMGGTGKYMKLTQEDNMMNADFGLLFHPSPFIGIGIAGHNVIGADTENWVNRDLTLGLAGFVLNYAQIDVDVTKDFDADAVNTWNFALGAQGIILGGLTLRSGFYWNQVMAKNLYGAGIGWSDPKYADLGLSFQGDIENTRNYILAVNLNIKIIQ